MREMLFRGKTERGRWIEGDLIHYQSGEVTIIEKPFSKYGHEATEIFRRTLVLPNTICQYTGLTDKNGKKIFEGDILHSEQYPFVSNDNRNYFAVVVWVEYQALFGMEYYKYPESKVLGDCTGNVEPFGNVDISDYEVIGNIHDNPEILKKENEARNEKERNI